MEKPKITKPANESFEAAKSTAEKNELPLGKYQICAYFKLQGGKDYSLPLAFPVYLDDGETLEDLKKKSFGAAASQGLHNFGMDVYLGRYPKGHPVKFILKHDSGKKIEFTQNFDGRGYPIYEKS